MKDFLLFHLYGPMASWGDIAAGEVRDSLPFPGKSAVSGLLGAAMGVKRTEEAIHQKMSTGYGWACKVNQPGMLIRDYHTVQMPSQSRKIQHFTRKAELSSARHQLKTLLSSREYHMDAYYEVGIWKHSEEAPFTLVDLQNGLLEPKFTLYLGRKSCPLALPLQPQIINGNHIKEAFEKTNFDTQFICSLMEHRSVEQHRQQFYWEYDENVQSDQKIVFRDFPLSRKRWQFKERTVNKTDWENKNGG